MKDNKISQPGVPAHAPIQCQTKPLPRILVAEDEPDIRRLNSDLLMHYGYHVDTAEDGNSAWEALHAVRHAPECYNLLITDHNMPGLTGLDLIKKLRDARMPLPVILATGTLSQEVLTDRYPWLQSVVMLPKPYSVDQLLGTVEAVLRTANGAQDQRTPPKNWLKPPPEEVLRLL
jgi:DNA-binding response OmpR family regulator